MENQTQVFHASHHRPGLRRMEKWKTNNRFPTFPRLASDDDSGLPPANPKTKEKEVGRCAASSFFFFLSRP
jgi:hypothetical protein